MAARIERRGGAGAKQSSGSLSSIRRPPSREQRSRCRTRATGAFVGSEIPTDLQRQWIQGTGPAAKPNAPVENSIRNVAYALLSGADGWMFDGEDALGQISTMSLDNQRNLKLAIHRDPVFMKVAEQVAGEMNKWAQGFFGRPIIDDWKKQLDFTTKIFRARGLHLDDRHVRHARRRRLFRVDRRCDALRRQQPPAACAKPAASLVLYLPKIQTAEEAALWNDILSALEQHLGLPDGTIKVYVLVEQVEACFQLMEIRAALGQHFVGFNTGRWDYINSVSDAMAWDREFVNPEHRRHHDDLRLHAESTRTACAAPCNTPDKLGPVRALAGRHGAQHPGRLRGRRLASGMKRAVAGRRARAARGRQRQVGRPLEDGPHRPAGLGEGRAGQPARTEVPAAHLHAGRRGRPHPARAGAANRARRPRSAERRAAVRQRVRRRASGRRAQAGRLSSATTTSCT